MSVSATSKARTPAKRRYRGTVQAEVRALTRQKIIEATLALYAETWLDQLTLEQVAQRAGVTIQTVLRHFGSKDALIAAAGQQSIETETLLRTEVAVADLDGAIAHLLNHYETQGDLVLRTLAQEGSHPMLGEFAEAGRVVHRAWVARVFGPYLERRSGVDRERLLAQLVAVCDVYTWQLLRRQAGLSAKQYALAIRELLVPLLRAHGHK